MRRDLPAAHRLLNEPAIVELQAVLGRAAVKRELDAVLDRARAAHEPVGYDDILGDAVAALERRTLETLRAAINGTGIILHTNLGRAPIAGAALSAIARVSHGYSNLEYDLAAGERGSRYAHVAGALRELTGCADALVVNNCAAAVLLVLDTFAKGREVVVARGELVEIGGGFRVPDVLARSGARLVEVGTTNRVYAGDYKAALGPQTALFLRTHPSNYRIEGFTHAVDARELVALGRRAGVPVVEDLGSGAMIDLAEYGLAHERTVQEALADGIGLVTFSGDKLLGGPQAGIIVGEARLVGRLRGNPLLRALRVDKMTLAALGATLELIATPASRTAIPLYRMLATTLDELRLRAVPYLAALRSAELVETDAYAGGGSLPQWKLPSLAIAIAAPSIDRIDAALRSEDPAIVGRIRDGRLLFDLRTIAPEEDDTVIASLVAMM